MKINKESIERFMKDCFEVCGEDFEEMEVDNCVFSNGGDSFTCEHVNTEGFTVEVKKYDFDIDENDGSVRISGSANVNYTVIGLFLDGDDDGNCGYVECGRESSGAGISFTIDVDSKDFRNSELMIEIE